MFRDMIKSSRLALNDGFSQVYLLPNCSDKKVGCAGHAWDRLSVPFLLFLQSALVFNCCAGGIPLQLSEGGSLTADISSLSECFGVGNFGAESP